MHPVWRRLVDLQLASEAGALVGSPFSSFSVVAAALRTDAHGSHKTTAMVDTRPHTWCTATPCTFR